MQLRFEFLDDAGELFTSHWLDEVRPMVFRMVCEGIPVKPGWRLYRDGNYLAVVEVDGMQITCREDEP